MSDKLKAQAISGVKWGGVSMGVITGLQFLTLAVLARLLSPSDFGVVAMAMVVVGFVQGFSDMGLSNAVIQRQNVPKDHLSSLFWINTLTGILLFIFILLVSPLAVVYFAKTELFNYLVLAGLVLLISPGGQVFNMLLRKELRFKTLSKIEIMATTVYSVSAIGLALAEYGALSLILGQVIRSLFTVGVLFFVFRKEWLPRFHFSWKEVRGYLSFGAFQMGERVINYLCANIDYIIIGRVLGPAALGFYSVAYQIMMLPLHKVNPIIGRVAFPTFSRIQHDNSAMRRGYCKAINYISMLSFPMLAGMFVVAPEFIKLVYGPKWAPSIIVLQIFCLAGAFKSLINPTGSILLAKGRADISFYWNVFAVIVISVAVLVGVNWGIVGVSIAILSLQLPFFLIIQPIANKLIDLKLRQCLGAIQSPLFCSGIMLATILSLKQIAGSANTLLVFALTVSVGAITYGVSYYIKDRVALIELKSMLRGS
jgi:O-antigen/teichoic acid export membrane protein